MVDESEQSKGIPGQGSTPLHRDRRSARGRRTRSRPRSRPRAEDAERRETGRSTASDDPRSRGRGDHAQHVSREPQHPGADVSRRDPESGHRHSPRPTSEPYASSSTSSPCCRKRRAAISMLPKPACSRRFSSICECASSRRLASDEDRSGGNEANKEVAGRVGHRPGGVSHAGSIEPGVGDRSFGTDEEKPAAPKSAEPTTGVTLPNFVDLAKRNFRPS